MGGAYKPRDRSRSPGVLSTNVQYGWMKHQVRQGGACSLRCWGWRLGSPSPSTATLVPSGPPGGGQGSISPLTEFWGPRQFWDEAGLTGLFAWPWLRPWTQVLSLRTHLIGPWEEVLCGPGASDRLQRISQSLRLFLGLFVFILWAAPEWTQGLMVPCKRWREWKGALLGERKREPGIVQNSFEPNPASRLGRLWPLAEASAIGAIYESFLPLRRALEVRAPLCPRMGALPPLRNGPQNAAW